MSKKITFISNAVLILAVSFFAVLFSGCASNRKAIAPLQEPVVTTENDGIQMALRFLDEGLLVSRHGKADNPFLTNYNQLMLRRLLVFELTLRSLSGKSLDLFLKNGELTYGGRSLIPANRFQLSNYWAGVDRDPRSTKSKELLIQKLVLPDHEAVRPGGSIKGYLVFQGDLPSSGAATVVVRLSAGSALLPFQFSFVFKD